MAILCSAIFAICFSLCHKTVPKQVQQGHPYIIQKALVSAFLSTDPNIAAHTLLKELSKRFIFIQELSRMLSWTSTVQQTFKSAFIIA